MRATLARPGAVSAAVISGALLCASPAVAHDYPVGHAPNEGTTVAKQPGTVSVTFNDVVLTHPAPPDLVVTGPDGKHYETGCPSLVDHTVSVRADLGPNGRYTTTWRVVSADGHPVSGTSSFTFQGASGVHRAAGTTAGQACRRGSSATTGGTVASSSNTSSSDSDRGPLIAVGVALVGAVAGVTALVLRARRHPRPEEESDSENDD